MDLRNEFASVVVELDNRARGPRLLVRDVKTGRTRYFDPLELEALAWLSEEQMAPLMDPSATRWSGAPSAMGDLIRTLSENGVEMQD